MSEATTAAWRRRPRRGDAPAGRSARTRTSGFAARLATMAPLLVLVLALAPSAGCRDQDARPAAMSARQAPPAPVRVAPLRRGPLRLSLGFPTELRAPETVELASKISGRLLEVRVQMGDRACAGQVLARIDDAELRAQLREAEAGVLVARTAVRRAEVDDRIAATELARKEPLAKKDLITRQELDTVRFRRDSAAIALVQAIAQVSQAQAKLALLRHQLAEADIRAPFKGWVQSRQLDGGAVVAAGTPILRLVRTEPLIARFLVGERYIGELRRRSTATQGVLVAVEVPAHAGRSFSGRIARVAPAMETASRSAAVEAELENAEGLLMPGMYGRVEVDLGTLENALLLPLRALVEDDGAAATDRHPAGSSPPSGPPARSDPAAGTRRARVFVATNGRARAIEVLLGAEQDGYGEVQEGLAADALVIVEGQSALADGQPIHLVDGPGGVAAGGHGPATIPAAGSKPLSKPVSTSGGAPDRARPERQVPRRER